MWFQTWITKVNIYSLSFSILLWIFCITWHQWASAKVKQWGQAYFLTKNTPSSQPLQDLGHMLLPNTQQWRIVAELTVFGPLIWALCTIMVQRNWAILARFLRSHACAMALRALCFSVTLLPDASQMCDKSIYSGGCHDLLFSGHIIAATLAAGTLFTIGPVRWRWLSIVSLVFASILTISSRNHYTVDVIVSLFVGPALWTLWR